MDKMKVSFVIKVDSEIELNEREVGVVKQCIAEGKEVLRVEELKQELADNFGIDKSCVEVIEHSEELIEGIGE